MGIQVTLNGAPYPGMFLHPVTATFRSSKIMPSSDVVVWNGTSFVIDPASTTSAGTATVSFDTDPDFAVESAGQHDGDHGTRSHHPGDRRAVPR